MMQTTKSLKTLAWTYGLVPLTLVGISIPAVAQTPTHPHSVNSRLREQNARIRQGVHNGSLTRREANRMRLRDSRIHYHEARDRVTDGHISRREHRQLERQLNRTSHAIYHQKHDAQHR